MSKVKQMPAPKLEKFGLLISVEATSAGVAAHAVENALAAIADGDVAFDGGQIKNPRIVRLNDMSVRPAE